MKKLVNYLLCGLLLCGCSTQNNLLVSTDSSTFELTTYEENEIKKLFNEDNYFTPFVNSLDDINWDINELGLSINLNGSRDIQVTINYEGDIDLVYTFDDISFTYDEKGSSTLVNLELSIDSEAHFRSIYLKVQLNQDEPFDIVYNSNNTLSYNSSDTTKLELDDLLQKEIIHHVVDEYQSFYLFLLTLQSFKDSFLSLINFGPLYYNPNIEIISTIYDVDSDNENYDAAYTPHFNKLLFLVPDEYFSVSNWDTTKLYNTASILFYLENEINNSTCYQRDSLLQTLLSIKPNIFCIKQKCTTNFETNEFTFTLDKNLNFYFIQGLDVTTLNLQLSTLFANFQNFNIEQTLLRVDGIVQIEENNAYFINHKKSYLNYAAFDKLYIEVINNSNNKLLLHVTPYRVNFNWLSNSKDCYIETVEGEILYPELIFNEVNMNDYIVDHLDKFQSWELTLENNDALDFYRILSAKKIRLESR